MTRLVVLFALAVSVFAQSQTGRITGNISDPSGAAIPNVEVTATDQDTGVPTKGVSSSTGVYAIPFLPPGRYRIEVSHAGFKKYERPNFVLATSEVLPLDIQLELGNITETVSVEATAPLLESTTSEVGQFIGAKAVADMPLNGRRAMSLVAMTAATVWVNYGGEAKPNFSLAGGRTQSQMFWIDGGAGQNMRLGVGQVDIDPPVEVIREFRVVQNTYSAEFGGSAGGLDRINDQERHQPIARVLVRVLPQRQDGCPELLRGRQTAAALQPVRRHRRWPDPKEQDALFCRL